VADLEI